jgi:curved DNA-binding protein
MRDAEPDHYSTLGLDRRCTLEQIRTAYRLLAKRHHPDVNQSSREAVERSQELNAAYEVLSDPSRRAAYDRKLRATERPNPKAPSTKIQRNITQSTRLRIDDFLRGASIIVRVNDPANPTGAEVYPLAIPAGTAPGARFRISRTGGGFVTVRVGVLPGFRFKARGSDLCGDLRISAQRAKQGGVETIVGPAGSTLRVSIPAGVGRGEVVRLRGEGLPKAHGGRGDLLVRIVYRPEVRISRGAAR